MTSRERLAIVLATLTFLAATFGTTGAKFMVGHRWPLGAWLTVGIAAIVALAMLRTQSLAGAFVGCVLAPPILGLAIAIAWSIANDTYSPPEWRLQISAGGGSATLLGLHYGALVVAANGWHKRSPQAPRLRRFVGGWLIVAGVVTTIYAFTRSSWFVPTDMIGTAETSKASGALSGMCKLAVILSLLCVGVGLRQLVMAPGERSPRAGIE